jgi:hypothetical protein
MLRLSRAAALTLCVAIAVPAQAQQAPPAITVRTFTLRHMRPADAAQLIAPYAGTPGSAVFQAGRSLRAITVRETPAVLARIDSLLKAHDRPAQVIRLRFQLLAADETPTRDPTVVEIDSTLRRLFRFAGYRLLAEGVSTATENEDFSLTLGTGDDRFKIGGTIGGLSAEEGRRSVHVLVGLGRPGSPNHEGRPVPADALFSTGVTVPLGQTVVLGSAAPGGKTQALILVIRPELVRGSEP